MVSVHALRCWYSKERSLTRDSNSQGCHKQKRFGSKVQTLVYSHENKHSHRRRSGSTTCRHDTMGAQLHTEYMSHIINSNTETHQKHPEKIVNGTIIGTQVEKLMLN